MLSTPIRPLTTLADAIAADPIGYVELAVPAESFVAGFDLGRAVGVLTRTESTNYLLMQGDSARVAAHAESVIDESARLLGEPVQRLTVPVAASGSIGWVRHRAWSWMIAHSAPPLQPREADVIDTDDADRINALLDAANDDASTRPGHPEIEQWAAIADPHDTAGRYLAVAAVVRWQSGGRVLVSVATHPEARRQGLAGAVSSYLTRAVIESRRGPLALGFYAENSTAQRVYERIGFELRSENDSGWLVEPTDS